MEHMKADGFGNDGKEKTITARRGEGKRGKKKKKNKEKKQR